MPKLTQWAEDNIPEGLSIFGLGLCEFNRKHKGAPSNSIITWIFINSNRICQKYKAQN
jgi:hypothetical protein